MFDECREDIEDTHSIGPDFKRYLRDALRISPGPAGSGMEIVWEADGGSWAGPDAGCWGMAEAMGIIS